MSISKEDWHTCKICNKNIKELCKEFGGSGIYNTEVFAKHLDQYHKITPEDYFEKISDRPKCSCQICNLNVDLLWKGKSDFKWRQYKCGRNDGVKKWSKEAKVTRLGKNNPMHNKKPWNKGKTKDNSESLKIVSQKMTGRNISEETKQKQSKSAKSRLIHGHTGLKHSEESKDKMRQSTLSMIQSGKFKYTKTKPHLEFAKILTELNVAFQEEYVIKYWSFDFFLTDFHVLIEVDGDYFHSNPKFYDKPKTKTQKINSYRDQKKNDFCESNGYALIRIWEDDIINNKEKVLCSLKKLFTFGQ